MVKATFVPPVPTEGTITLEGLTIAQGELVMAALRSFRSSGLLSATKDAQAVEDALESAGICRKGRLPKAGRSGPSRKYYVAKKTEHSFILQAVTDPSASDEEG